MKHSAVRLREAEEGRRPFGHFPQMERWNQGAWILRDRTLLGLEMLLDEAFRIPGTGVRFGLDGIIGVVPGVGDVVGGLLSLIIPVAAWMRGVAYVTLARMAVNVAIGVLVGSIPLLGDVFDVAWEANRRNYRLLQRHVREPRRNTWRDWIFLLVLAAGLGLVFRHPAPGGDMARRVAHASLRTPVS